MHISEAASSVGTLSISTLYFVFTADEAEFMSVQFLLRFLGIILRVLRLEVSVYNVKLQNSFKPFLLKGDGSKISYYR